LETATDPIRLIPGQHECREVQEVDGRLLARDTVICRHAGCLLLQQHNNAQVEALKYTSCGTRQHAVITYRMVLFQAKAMTGCSALRNTLTGCGALRSIFLQN
jgi:hypothetical protein